MTVSKMNHGNGYGYAHPVTPTKAIPEESKPYMNSQSDVFWGSKGNGKDTEPRSDGKISYFSIGFPRASKTIPSFSFAASFRQTTVAPPDSVAHFNRCFPC